MTSRRSAGKKPIARRLIIFYAALGSFLVLCTGFLWFWLNPLDLPATPTFSGYRSSAQLNGSSVSKTELLRIKNDAIDGWYYEYQLTYSPSNVVVYERDASEHPGMYDNCSGMAPPLADYESTCASHPLKDGGHYVVVVDKYKGDIFGVDVEARIGTTSIYIAIPDSLRAAYASYDWQAFFESLTPVDLGHIPYQRVTP